MLLVTLIVILSVFITLSTGLFGCQSQTPVAPTTSANTTSDIPTTPATSVTTTPPALPPAPVTPPPPTTADVTAPAPPPPPSAPQPVLPVLASITADKTGAELFSAMVRVTAVFRFDAKNDPGYYYISLLSGSDSFGTKEVEWYRAAKQIELTWTVLPDNDAYNRLKNNELVSAVFQTPVSYSKYVSLTTVPRDTPTTLENQIVTLINQQRLNRGFSLPTWDTDLYKQAPQRLTAFGEEGAILPPPAGQPYPETAYVAIGGGRDAVTVFENWLISAQYSTIMTDPNVKSYAIRTDIYNNQKFYAVGLFRTQ